jgi:hypothetical protein
VHIFDDDPRLSLRDGIIRLAGEHARCGHKGSQKRQETAGTSMSEHKIILDMSYSRGREHFPKKN